MINIEKCPCCKDYAFLKNAMTKIANIDAPTFYYVQCHNKECGIRTPYGEMKEVIDIWNRRDSNVQPY